MDGQCEEVKTREGGANFDTPGSSTAARRACCSHDARWQYAVRERPQRDDVGAHSSILELPNGIIVRGHGMDDHKSFTSVSHRKERTSFLQCCPQILSQCLMAALSITYLCSLFFFFWCRGPRLCNSYSTLDIHTPLIFRNPDLVLAYFSNSRRYEREGAVVWCCTVVKEVIRLLMYLGASEFD